MSEPTKFDGWDMKDGLITMCPMTGYATAVAAGMGCMLRLEFARTPEQMRGKHDAVQLAMTPDQARELAQALSRMVAKIDMAPPPVRDRN